MGQKMQDNEAETSADWSARRVVSLAIAGVGVALAVGLLVFDADP